MALAINGGQDKNVGLGSSIIPAITTTYTNDYIFAYCNNASTNTAPTISDTAGLTWHQIAQVTSSGSSPATTLTAWYAVSSGTLSSDTVTIAQGSSAGNMVGGVFGVSGADTSAFDSNASLPSTSHATTSQTGSSNTFSTSNANDMIISFMGWKSNLSTLNAPASFTKVFSDLEGAAYGVGVAYDVVSSTQTNATANWSWINSRLWAEIVIGVKASAAVATNSNFLMFM